MLDPTDAVTEEEALSAILQRKGLPAQSADQFAGKVLQQISRPSDEQGQSRWIYLMDHQILAERVGDRFCVSKKQLQLLLDRVQPDPEIVRARNAGELFEIE